MHPARDAFFPGWFEKWRKPRGRSILAGECWRESVGGRMLAGECRRENIGGKAPSAAAAKSKTKIQQGRRPAALNTASYSFEPSERSCGGESIIIVVLRTRSALASNEQSHSRDVAINIIVMHYCQQQPGVVIRIPMMISRWNRRLRHRRRQNHQHRHRHQQFK